MDKPRLGSPIGSSSNAKCTNAPGSICGGQYRCRLAIIGSIAPPVPGSCGAGGGGVRRAFMRQQRLNWRKKRRSASARYRSEEHTSELQSLMRISYAVFCLKKKKEIQTRHYVSEHSLTLTYKYD